MWPILTAFQEHGEIKQCNVLCCAADQLKPLICHKWWGFLSKGVPLLSDNAHLHTVMVEQQFGLELLPHPCLQHRSATIWLPQFWHLEEILCSCRSSSNEKVQQAVQIWLCEQLKRFSGMDEEAHWMILEVYHHTGGGLS